MDQLPKTPGAVGCSHCQGLGALETCESCGRPVCPFCALTWESCPEIAAREIRLGLGARLLDMDHDGRLGLVQGWRGNKKFIDLRDLRWLEGRIPLLKLGPAPTLIPGGRLLYPSFSFADDPSLWKELRVEDLAHNSSASIPTTPLEGAPRLIALSEEGGLALVVQPNETLEVIDLALGSVVNVFQDRGNVIHSVAASEELALLALGSYDRIALFRLSDHQPRPRPLSSFTLEECGDVLWLGLGGRRLAVIGEHGLLRVFQLHQRGGRIRRQMYEARAEITRRNQASITPDGRLVAVAHGREVKIHQLFAQQDSSDYRPDYIDLEAHTDVVNLVRFVRQGRVLITADMDNRIIFWPRRGDRVTTRIIKAHLPDEKFPFPEDL